ncbi:SusD/RagB family nutrient-binding outer membrane lipoprotein [Daejeonella sp. JGW-45]|uniref:SusD/RagB family nutrient-binding outer membrane lipoprotein n=1 Tax=Daejeonella sp. JGW-45 TaxID=3034148 RepID=UPI0023ED66F6|nr:SusD/RagB family nutrient-binding outer membrane lipoprotein [Daejeonella sp. JGW-45]
MKSQKSLYRKWATRVMLFLAPIVILTACTKNFEEINTNPAGLKELAAPDLRSLFPGALVTGLGAGYNETTMLLFAGVYSQHFASTNPAQESHRYVIVQRWQDIWPQTYTGTMPKLVNIIEATKGGKEPTMNAIARIWKVYAFMRATDYWGPIPYSKIGKDTTVVNYDDQKSIYFDFFKELEEATTDLKANLTRPSFESKDLIYNGSNEKWLKFANTLRLRLALRISDVEPAKAKAEAEKAFANGVMTEVADGAYFKTSADFNHGLANFMARNGSRMSTSMESLLVGYNDPRLPMMWSPALGDGKFHGVRNGMTVAQQNMPQNGINNNSAVSLKYAAASMTTTPQAVFYASEAYFLRAEGALNGWNMGGTAQAMYEKGIEISMRENGVTDAGAIAAYINGTSLPIAPPNAFPTPPLTDIPVKFSTVPEKQREQIGTQKWIALFPESHEAWANMRRSGYPKMYPLMSSQNPDIAADKMIRRISFLDREIIANGVAVKAAVPLLGGGPDNVATRLWWDKSKSN